MIQFFRNSIRYSSNLLPLGVLKSKKHPPKIVLYHAIADEPPPYISAYGVKSVARFKKDIDFLCKNYEPVSLEEITQNQANKNLIHFTFDDGLQSCYTTIGPILKEKGIPASFFINPNFINNDKIYHRFLYELALTEIPGLSGEFKSYNEKNALIELAESKNIDLEGLAKKHNPYMTLEEVKSLHDDGFLIGGHSMDHPEFYDISFEKQYEQIAFSMKWIQNQFKPSIKAFAFPYTDDGITNKLLQKAQDDHLIDISLGTAGLKYDMFANHFQRIPMEPKRLSAASQIFKYEYLYFKLRAIANKNTVTRD